MVADAGKPASPRVFVSYSRGSDEHDERVLELAQRLADSGLDVKIDRFEPTPAEGQPAWIKTQIQEAKFVLLVCDATYKARFEGRDEDEERETWETLVAGELLGQSGKLDHSKVVAVLLDGAAKSDIPVAARPGISHRLPKGYDELERRLHGRLAVPRKQATPAQSPGPNPEPAEPKVKDAAKSEAKDPAPEPAEPKAKQAEDPKPAPAEPETKQADEPETKQADEPEPVVAKAEPKPAKGSIFGKLGGVAVFGLVAAVAIYFYTKRLPDTEAITDKIDTVDSESPELIQCFALAKNKQIEFQGGLDIDYEDAQAKLGFSNEMLAKYESTEDSASAREACIRAYGKPSSVTVKVVDEDGIGRGGVGVTAIGAGGLKDKQPTDDDGLCRLSIPSWMADTQTVELSALSSAKDFRGDVVLTVGELRGGAAKISLQQLDKCTLSFIELREDQEKQAITDIEQVMAVWGATEREAVETENKGTFKVSCRERRDLAGHYRVTRNGRVPEIIEFESAAAPAPIQWPGDTGDSSDDGEGGDDGGSSSASTPRCQDHNLTKRAIVNVLRGKGCDRVKVEVRGGQLSVPSEGISGSALSSGALRRCQGEIKCPD